MMEIMISCKPMLIRFQLVIAAPLFSAACLYAVINFKLLFPPQIRKNRTFFIMLGKDDLTTLELSVALKSQFNQIQPIFISIKCFCHEMCTVGGSSVSHNRQL